MLPRFSQVYKYFFHEPISFHDQLLRNLEDEGKTQILQFEQVGNNKTLLLSSVYIVIIKCIGINTK